MRLGLTTLLWLIAALTMATLPFLAVLPFWEVPAIIALMAWRIARERRAMPPAARWLRLALTIVLVAATVFGSGLTLGVESAAPTLIILLWIKLLEIKSARDVLVTCFAALFLVASVLLTNPSLGQTAYALVAVLVILAATVHFHRRAAPVSSGGTARWTRTSAGRAPWRWSLPLHGSLQLLIQSLPLALLLFVLVPRPSLNLSIHAGQAISGISDQLRPGDIARLVLSQEPAMRVEFPNRDMPALSDCYWRGVVLNRAEGDGLSWRRHVERVETETWPLVRDAAAARMVPVTYEVSQMASQQPWIYALETCEQPLAKIQRLTGLVQERSEGLGQSLRYTLTSRLDHLPADRPLDSFTRPKVDPRVLALARGWRETAKAADPARRGDHAMIIDLGLRHLINEGFVYSLEPGDQGDEPLATFLFERKRGFCGHYAAAFATLLRCADVPARVVVGYRGGEINSIGDFLMVRQSHAHAWAEAWLGPGRGWRRVDPTNLIARADGVPGPLPTTPGTAGATAADANQGWWDRTSHGWRHWKDYIDASWDHHILGYDADRQAALLDDIGLAGWGRVGLIALLAVGGGAVLAALALLLNRRRHAADPRQRLIDEAQRLWLRWCAAMAKRGVKRQAWEGPMDFARRLEATTRPVAGLPEVAAIYTRIRYGGEADRALVGRMRALVRQR